MQRIKRMANLGPQTPRCLENLKPHTQTSNHHSVLGITGMEELVNLR